MPAACFPYLTASKAHSPHCPPFFQSPIDVATARVASVHSITTQQSSGSTGPGRNAFLLFSFHSTTRLLPKISPSLPPPPAFVFLSGPSLTYQRNPFAHTHTHLLSHALLPSTFPTLSLPPSPLPSPPPHRITSQNLETSFTPTRPVALRRTTTRAYALNSLSDLNRPSIYESDLVPCYLTSQPSPRHCRHVSHASNPQCRHLRSTVMYHGLHS